MILSPVSRVEHDELVRQRHLRQGQERRGGRGDGGNGERQAPRAVRNEAPPQRVGEEVEVFRADVDGDQHQPHGHERQRTHRPDRNRRAAGSNPGSEGSKTQDASRRQPTATSLRTSTAQSRAQPAPIDREWVDLCHGPVTSHGALVTGASSGIGEATRVRSLHRCTVPCCTAQGPSDALAARDRWSIDRGRCHRRDQRRRRGSHGVGAWPTRHLINNAGVMLLGRIVRPRSRSGRLVALNLQGLLYVAHAALPHLLAPPSVFHDGSQTS